eukprot:TRINITY_DN2620_c0_g1_i2.p1 TRINITY_DN2620_c0_g1~~TRINITY_DN2620_c0_g1_i2.p1  ORF type:complete len:1195 (-),score=320.07 TRINITY_DN2620_c0_g1_i2:2618-6202(-)
MSKLEPHSCFACGYGRHGALGRGSEDSLKHPARIDAVEGKNIVQICAGNQHTLFLSDSGDVYAAGWGHCGQLGSGSVESQYIPRRLESLVGKKIVEMSAGGIHSMTLLEQGHSLFLSNEGKCYACGGGLMGQTGLGTASDVLRPHRVYLQKRILHVSAGGMHSIFVTDVGETFTCGHGKFGQLGHGDRQNRDAPERILSLAKERIVQASAGGFFSLFLAEDGSVFACGSFQCGSLGLEGLEDDVLIPQLLKGMEPVLQVAAGLYHSIFLTKSGKILACGDGRRGQLGLGKEIVEVRNAVPKHLKFPQEHKIIQVSAGCHHSMFLTDEGSIFGCGDNSMGQLGIDAKATKRCYWIPVRIDHDSPYGAVVQISLGTYHSVFISSSSAGDEDEDEWEDIVTPGQQEEISSGSRDLKRLSDSLRVERLANLMSDLLQFRSASWIHLDTHSLRKQWSGCFRGIDAQKSIIESQMDDTFQEEIKELMEEVNSIERGVQSAVAKGKPAQVIKDIAERRKKKRLALVSSLRSQVEKYRVALAAFPGMQGRLEQESQVSTDPSAIMHDEVDDPYGIVKALDSLASFQAQSAGILKSHMKKTNRILTELSCALQEELSAFREVSEEGKSHHVGYVQKINIAKESKNPIERAMALRALDEFDSGTHGEVERKRQAFEHNYRVRLDLLEKQEELVKRKKWAEEQHFLWTEITMSMRVARRQMRDKRSELEEILETYGGGKKWNMKRVQDEIEYWENKVFQLESKRREMQNRLAWEGVFLFPEMETQFKVPKLTKDIANGVFSPLTGLPATLPIHLLSLQRSSVDYKKIVPLSPSVQRVVFGQRQLIVKKIVAKNESQKQSCVWDMLVVDSTKRFTGRLNIPMIYGFWMDERHSFQERDELFPLEFSIEMEYIEGESVASKLQRSIKDSPDDEGLSCFSYAHRKWILLKVARTLAALHRYGVVHGDIGLHNVILHGDGEVYLVDMSFGIPSSIASSCLGPEFSRSVLMSDVLSFGRFLMDLLFPSFAQSATKGRAMEWLIDGSIWRSTTVGMALSAEEQQSLRALLLGLFQDNDIHRIHMSEVACHQFLTGHGLVVAGGMDVPESLLRRSVSSLRMALPSTSEWWSFCVRRENLVDDMLSNFRNCTLSRMLSPLQIILIKEDPVEDAPEERNVRRTMRLLRQVGCHPPSPIPHHTHPGFGALMLAKD